MESDRNPLTENNNLIIDSSESANIIIEDIQGENSEPPQNCLSNMIMLPPIILADIRYVFPDSLPIFTNEQRLRLEKTLSVSRKISWLCIIDCVLASFILYFTIFYLILFVVFLPLVGFFGSRRYHKGLSICYLIYFVLILAMRVSLTVLDNKIPAYVIQGIIIILESYTVYCFTVFLRALKALTLQELNFLLGRTMNGLMNNNNPEDAAVKIISDPPLLYQRMENFN